MAKTGFLTGLDIGTSTIKVIVANFTDGVMQVVGVSVVDSQGVKDGIIVDIEAAARAISTAVKQAEEKAGIIVDKVVVGLPANLLRIDATQGMVNIQAESKEITDEHVEEIVRTSLTKSMTPDREVITLVPEEFVVDGFKGIRDPRGMLGFRLEMRGVMYTGPSTVLHNLRKAVATAGLQIEQIVVAPLAFVHSVLNEGEREFGATVIDLGGGQTTIAVASKQEIQFTNVYPEGSDYVTQDIARVFTIPLQSAEYIKRQYATVDLANTTEDLSVQIDEVGMPEPDFISDRFLAEVAVIPRIYQIMERIRYDLDRGRLNQLPGGVVLIGGGAILQGITGLAQEVFSGPARVHVPNHLGLRNPMFSNVISLLEYAGDMSDIDHLAHFAITTNQKLSRQPINYGQSAVTPASTYTSNSIQPDDIYEEESWVDDTVLMDDTFMEEVGFQQEPVRPEPQQQVNPSPQPKKKVGDRVRGIFGSLFD